MRLKNIEIVNAKPRAKPYRLPDGGNLFLLVMPTGSKWWRYKYRVEGREKLLALGTYPDVGLKDAREKHQQARKQLAAGIDPGANRKAAKAAKAESGANTFEVVAREWLEKQSARWTESNKTKVTRRLEKDVFPWFGRQPIENITAPEILKILNRIEERGTADTAHRVLQTCGQVFRYAVASGRTRYNPCPDLRGALMPVKKEHFAAITDPDKIGGLLRAIQNYQGEPITKAALQLAPLVFVRPGELRAAEWSEFDLKKAVWSIPAERMKVKTQGGHLVPLSRQAIKILSGLQPLTGSGTYVFPSVRTRQRPMSDNTLNAALRRMGFTKDVMTAHGFRAMARTILDEVLGVRPDYIEHQLAHAVRDPNGRAYNRTAHLEARKKMMQDWADYLDSAGK